MHALKQFRHYLLGRKFSIITDHAPLQWLSAQKMEGLLAMWALAIQEYDFTINTTKNWYTEMLMHFLERITLTLSILLQLHSFLYLQKICDNNNSLTLLYMKFMKHFFEIIQPHPSGINFLFLGTHSFGFSYICMMAWYVANILHHLA